MTAGPSYGVLSLEASDYFFEAFLGLWDSTLHTLKVSPDHLRLILIRSAGDDGEGEFLGVGPLLERVTQGPSSSPFVLSFDIPSLFLSRSSYLLVRVMFATTAVLILNSSPLIRYPLAIGCLYVSFQQSWWNILQGLSDSKYFTILRS